MACERTGSTAPSPRTRASPHRPDRRVVGHQQAGGPIDDLAEVESRCPRRRSSSPLTPTVRACTGLTLGSSRQLIAVLSPPERGSRVAHSGPGARRRCGRRRPRRWSTHAAAPPPACRTPAGSSELDAFWRRSVQDFDANPTSIWLRINAHAHPCRAPPRAAVWISAAELGRAVATDRQRCEDCDDRHDPPEGVELGVLQGPSGGFRGAVGHVTEQVPGRVADGGHGVPLDDRSQDRGQARVSRNSRRRRCARYVFARAGCKGGVSTTGLV